MSRAQNLKKKCLHCGKCLMPVKSMEWDTRQYHKKCNKEIKTMEEGIIRTTQLEEDDYRHFEIIKFKLKL